MSRFEAIDIAAAARVGSKGNHRVGRFANHGDASTESETSDRSPAVLRGMGSHGHEEQWDQRRPYSFEKTICGTSKEKVRPFWVACQSEISQSESSMTEGCP